MANAAELPKEYLVSKLDELPTLPSVVYELSRVINDPMSSTKEIEAIMENDQSITAKVLRLVNSAYYAIPGGVKSLSRAIGYLGFDTINQLVLSANIIKALEVKKPTKFNMNEFWKHSVGVAIASETIAKIVHHPLPSDLFTCGLVHDMGKVALYTIDSDYFLKIANCAMDNALSFVEAEEKLGAHAHSDIGGLLAEKWNLPLQIQAVIRHHHQYNPLKRGGLSQELSQNVDIVTLANLLVHALKFGNSGYEKIPGAPAELMQRLTISPTDGFKKTLLTIRDNLIKGEEFIKVIGGSP